ncbi:exonuclease SbcCD subunit D C-terminal domain-containing protein [Psychrobacter sp. FDAARGOS_221]|uniref:exonuclease SbcCD subunit D C-terminal domain-containing protein n=1 Tax=Psychrobacter sp. FDAARGOS_221 TaxID=1975705 RepID=UPI000BB59062|nr:exonuclease SbcCD subunit D C-terminal domain-containing protein [Psychrobacter sp. FDAARGOS_221]PNK59570.1 exonuclease sbcCD subunit D [Psychrobacter sp. FDAARGOS_221]
MSKSTELSAAAKPLTILHTSDWHLGRRLYGQLRYEEFEAFLAWLTKTIEQYQVDILIVAGDIFDTMTPSNRAQALYYEFLGLISSLHCDHVVIVAGNHDSPTFLDAPANVLKFLNVHVIGTACDDIADEVLVLKSKSGEPQCIIAAVPYLRDRDVRNTQAGESGADKDANLLAGIREHYAQVADIAKDKQAELNAQSQRHIPIIATGHLFAAGGTTTEDDGVRDLYVGNLGKISADTFDDGFDYVALGHLHVPQKVGGSDTIRYSGSPIAMGFGEAKQTKQVLLVQFGEQLDDFSEASELSGVEGSLSTSVTPVVSNTVKDDPPFTPDLFDSLPSDIAEDNGTDDNVVQDSLINIDKDNQPTKNLYKNSDNSMQVVSVTVPCFQHLMHISGELQEILNALTALPTDKPIWIEVEYAGNEIVSDLREQINSVVADTPLQVLKIRNNQVRDKVLKSQVAHETLQDLDEMEVFERCLAANDVAESQRPSLREAYAQIVHDIHHEDKRAL